MVSYFRSKAWRDLSAMAVSTVFAFSVTPGAAASTYSVLHSFAGYPSDGNGPQAGLIAYNGYLWGTTWAGGSYGAGTIFKVDPNSGATTVVYSFDGTAGYFPHSKLFLHAGVFYGTTLSNASGNEMIYSFDPNTLVASDIHDFTDVGDCYQDGTYYPGFPGAQLAFHGGWLYGTSCLDGAYSQGTLYRVKLSGNHTFQVLHDFSGYMGGTTDGAYPVCGLFYHQGLFYGSTYGGGVNLDGTIFTVDPTQANPTATTVFQFPGGNPSPAAQPGSCLHYRAGYFYGATDYGGSVASGTIYKVALGTWQLTNLYSFPGGTSVGEFARGDVDFIGSTLYGTATWGGTSGRGTVFQLTNAGVLSVVHTFADGTDSAFPRGGVLNYGGSLFGTTAGNINVQGSLGKVFKVTNP